MSSDSQDSPTKILVIEDNPVALHQISDQIESHFLPKHEVHRANGIEQALYELKRSRFDIALLDLDLHDTPDLVGLMKLVQLRPRLAIIVIAAGDYVDICERALENGAQNYVTRNELSGPLLAKLIPYAIHRKANLVHLSNAATDREDEPPD